MAFDDIALYQRCVTRPELPGHSKARTSRDVSLIEYDWLKAIFLQMFDPVLTASAVRVFPDLNRQFATPMYPARTSCKNACQPKQNKPTIK
jgi:hypothetical protein